MNAQYLYLHSYVTLNNCGLRVPIRAATTHPDGDAIVVKICRGFQRFKAINYVNTNTAFVCLTLFIVKHNNCRIIDITFCIHEIKFQASTIFTEKNVRLITCKV